MKTSSEPRLSIAELKERERLAGEGFLTRPIIMEARDYHEFEVMEENIVKLHSSYNPDNKKGKFFLPLARHFEIGGLPNTIFDYGAVFYSPKQLGMEVNSHDNQCALTLYALKKQELAKGHAYEGREQAFWLDVEKKYLNSMKNETGLTIFQDKNEVCSFRSQVKRLYDVDLDQEMAPTAPPKRSRARQP